ncbi:MAG TPA: Ig-like domain-containing protein, partial [Verrucomicrobiae bacterium]|nr:Ig-like domain-containing protein [Verrucomicrobiae bacterium]
DGALRPASGSWDLGAYKYGNADTTAPTISLTAPANNATVSGVSVTVSANASDNVGVAGVQFKLNGTNLGAEDTSAPYSVTLNTMALINGTHTLSAVARDAAGNQTTASVRSIIVSNPPPSVALTSPANGANYTAPAAINLAASVVANGHTITRVQFFNGTTLLGEDLTAPYSFTWNSVAAGSYNLSARAVYGAGSTVASTSRSVSVTSASPSSITFAATSGIITAPFVAANGTISQPAYTGVTTGGRAAYTFTVSTAGDYLVSVMVNAPNDSANSLFVNIDAEPADPTMIWDIPIASGLTERTVAWRGSGTFDNAQFAPKVFSLSAGTHTLIVRGREANCQLGNITIRRK